MTEGPCEQELISQRLRDVEQRVEGHEERIAIVESSVTQYGERIKSVDERVTTLVKDSGGQNEKLDQIKRENSEENKKIISQVGLVNETLADHLHNFSEVSRRLKEVETSVGKVSDDLVDYKTKNASLLEKVDHAVRMLGRVEHMVAALIGDLLKALRGLVIKGSLVLAGIWIIYHYFPELKPHIKEILAIGFPG